MDLALTVKIHPIAFGVRQEDSGKVRTPHGVSLESTVVEDIFEYLDRRRTGVQPKVLPGTKLERLHGNQAVPPLILSMQVKLEKSARVDAVIVVEHQNLSELDIKNVLLVMVRLYHAQSYARLSRSYLSSFTPLPAQSCASSHLRLTM